MGILMSKSDSKSDAQGAGEALLTEARIGRLSTSSNDEPYVVPLSFVFHESRIYFHGSTEGKKMRHIAKNPRVCFEVDEGRFVPDEDACKLHWIFRSAIAYGTARVLEDIEEKVEGLRLLVDKYAPGKGNQITVELVESHQNLAVVMLEVNEITGRIEPARS